MSFNPDYFEDEDTDLQDESTPVSTIAGPQTPRQQVMSRIAQVRGSSASDPSSLSDKDISAMQYAQNSALTAGLGRAANALASGTGYKADNSGYDAIEKQGSTMAEKEMDRSAKVAKAIEDRKLKEAIAQNAQANKAAEMALREKQISGYNDRTKAMAGNQENRLNAANIRAANTILNDKNAQNEVKKLQAARSVQTLIDEIKSGKLTDSKGIRNQLTTLMSTIEMGGPGAHADRAAMGVDTLYTMAQDALSKYTSSPTHTIPKEFLSQLESEGNALGDRAAQNYHNITKSALSGADLSNGDPEADHGKVYTLAKQRRDQMLKSNGYDPETGESLRPKNVAGKGKSGGLISDAVAGGGRVTVTNGKEVLSIDLKDLPDAMKDGYQVKK